LLLLFNFERKRFLFEKIKLDRTSSTIWIYK